MTVLPWRGTVTTTSADRSVQGEGLDGTGCVAIKGGLATDGAGATGIDDGTGIAATADDTATVYQ